ncbi:MAG: TrkA family potassium uptake protein [bacterium]|nr:TrkA family potassium uptake protein [bacterium]
MRRFAVIGLGNFGFNVARRLYEDGHDVIAIDLNKDIIQQVKEYSTQSIIADATERGTLETLGIDDTDVAVVSLGEKLDASILVTLHLKEMGVGKIIVKALTGDHAKVLGLIGATEVVFPERDMAIRLAERLSCPTVLDQVEFKEGYSVLEIETPRKFWGLTLKDAGIRNQFNLSVILIRKGGAEGAAIIAPGPDDVIVEGDVLVLIGEDEFVEKFKNLS